MIGCQIVEDIDKRLIYVLYVINVNADILSSS